MSAEEVQSYEAIHGPFKQRYRYTEPSADELCGLIMGYQIVFQLVNDPALRADIRRQVTNLADYLAAYGYLLVRPNGGFTAQGPAGILPALEFPFNRVFERMTGQSFPSRINFEQAMEKAGVMPGLQGLYNLWSARGIGAIVFLPALSALLASLGLVVGAEVPFTSLQVARACAFWEGRDCYDVYDDKMTKEFAPAYLLKQLEARRRFEWWMQGAGSQGGGSAIGFPPFLALTALDDPDSTVRDAYLHWLPERRQHPDKAIPRFGETTCFASAVAVLLGAGADEEATLARLLQERHDEFHPDPARPGTGMWKDDWSLGESGINLEEQAAEEYFFPALDYMAALAVAWLHAKRRADAGSPVTTPGFPQLPNVAAWPAAVVPNAVLDDEGLRRQYLPPLTAIQHGGSLQRGPQGADLFLEAAPPTKSVEPAVVFPSTPVELLHDITITVQERDHDVDTGIDIQPGDEYEFEATGEINSGVILSGKNGPNGWDRIEYDIKFPLNGLRDPHNAHPYCLLGKLNSYFFIGKQRARQRWLFPEARRLYLRINDDKPGNGRGAFQCHIKVWRMLTPVGRHLYTTSPVERDNARDNLGWIDEGTACYVYGSQVAGTTALYRLTNPASGDRLYTTSPVERDNARNNLGWIDEGIACYVYDTLATGTIPLFRLSKVGWRELPPENPRCKEIRSSINGKGGQKRALAQQLEGLNPRDPEDKAEIRRINREINSLNQDIGKLEQEAQSLNCPP